LNPVSIRFSNF